MKGSQVCLCVAVMTYCPPTYSYTSYGESCEPKLVLTPETTLLGHNGGALGGDGGEGGGDGGGSMHAASLT